MKVKRMEWETRLKKWKNNEIEKQVRRRGSTRQQIYEREFRQDERKKDRWEKKYTTDIWESDAIQQTETEMRNLRATAETRHGQKTCISVTDRLRRPRYQTHMKPDLSKTWQKFSCNATMLTWERIDYGRVFWTWRDTRSSGTSTVWRRSDTRSDPTLAT